MLNTRTEEQPALPRDLATCSRLLRHDPLLVSCEVDGRTPLLAAIHHQREQVGEFAAVQVVCCGQAVAGGAGGGAAAGAGRRGGGPGGGGVEPPP